MKKSENSANSATTEKRANILDKVLVVRPALYTGNSTQTETETAKIETSTPTTETETTPDTVTTESKTVAVEPATQPSKADTIEELKKRLEIELNRLNHKKMLAKNREKFINCMDSLQTYISELKNENEFETQSGKLTFNILSTDNYNRSNFTENFSISNTALISKFCEMLLSEIQQKITVLETELLTA